VDGVSFYKENVYTSELFDKWIDDKYFNIVMQMNRHPRYLNQRSIDVQVKMFVDEKGVEIPLSWGLPKPNAEAAYKSLAKYAKDILPMSEIDVLHMNQAWEWTAQHFAPYMAESRVLDLEEALTKLDYSTSSGCPFNILYPKKRELFDKDPQIVPWLAEDWELLGVDPNWTCIATNSLKEELRTAQKIEDNSIRTFTSMPVDATVHGTRLFVDMNEKMYGSYLKSASAIGMSPFDGNWNTLYRKLNVFSKGYALDEKEYDSSLRVYLMWGCAEFRWQMLAGEFQTPTNKLRIQTYYRNLINTLILTPEGVVIQKKTGNPSGSCNTITDNTLILYTLMAYAWIKTVPNNFQTLEDFEILTAKALVGDDNTWTVSDEVHEFYNACTVIFEWKKLGITTTTDSVFPRKARDLDFLSARFLPLKGVMVPLYDREKILNSVLYAPKKDHTPCVTLERTAALLANGWADIQLRKFCRALIKWLIETYDTVLREDAHWIRAKTQIFSDVVYEERFTGLCLLQNQSILGKRERLIKPNKKEIEMSDNYLSENIANKIEKSENALTEILTQCDVSLTGQAYLDYALDPFKDSQGRPPCLGKPDRGLRNVVVSTYVETKTISRPATVPAGSNWDCHIMNLQQNNIVPVRQAVQLAPNFIQETPANPLINYGGIQVLAGAAGTALGMAQTVANLGVPLAYYSGQNSSRVIAKAHKTNNTTAMLTVQGNVLMYERTMPDPEETQVTFNYEKLGLFVPATGSLTAYDDPSGFRTPAELLQMPKSRQHPAKLGSYQVCVECGNRNAPGTDKPAIFHVYDGVVGLFIPVIVWFPGAVHSVPNVAILDEPFRSPFNVNGSYYTGLSSDSTVVVTGMWIIETNPPTADVRMMSLSHPSPPFDDCAMKMYAEIAYKMPSGVPYRDNGAGDWIQTIAALAQEAGAPGAGLLKLGGKAVNAVQRFYQSDFGQMTKVGNQPSERNRRPKLKSVPKARMIYGQKLKAPARGGATMFVTNKPQKMRAKRVRKKNNQGRRVVDIQVK
jgi:hypothetical protein